jgi:prepilin-type N-terminal cleavage/methylation domain-containing protein
VPTERRIAEAGFTLIEVLVAMVILSVGLLGVEALGIGAARSVVKAEDQTRLATAATRAMEGKQREVRGGGTITTGETCGADAASGLYLCSNIQTRLVNSAIPAHSARLSVRVAETSRGPFFTVSSYVFEPSLP